MSGAAQLALDLAGRGSFAREDFVIGAANRAALGWIDRWPDWPGGGLVLHGPEGAGKSHLGALWLARSGAVRIAAKVPLPDEPSTSILLEDVGPLADEATVLHLYNRLSAAGLSLLMTARTPPAAWAIGLPDLRSRLLALPAVALALPDDALLRALLRKLFVDRQLRIGDRILDFMLPRMERSYAAARALVASIDHAALASRREVTLPLVAAVLAGEAGSI